MKGSGCRVEGLVFIGLGVSGGRVRVQLKIISGLSVEGPWCLPASEDVGRKAAILNPKP